MTLSKLPLAVRVTSPSSLSLKESEERVTASLSTLTLYLLAVRVTPAAERISSRVTVSAVKA